MIILKYSIYIYIYNKTNTTLKKSLVIIIINQKISVEFDQLN